MQALLATGVFLFAAEVASRLDDWLRYDVPFCANSERERDLSVRDDHGVHGRPGGRFQKWRLNAFGFRGPEMTATPAPGMMRVMVLGASETFGLYESEGNEYPAQLAQRLHQRGMDRVEVVNAAMAGMTLPTMKAYWECWAARFGPEVVLIYPSPVFYLDYEPPSRWGAPSGPPPSPWSAPRCVGRVADVLRRTTWLRRVRLEYALYAQLRGRPDGWLYSTPPLERLEEFRADLAALVAAVQAGGARPVLLTHAIRATSPPRPEDWLDLREMRRYALRATEETIAAFEVEARDTVRSLGRQRGIRVIDAAGVLSGRRECFADLTHFSDEGAAALADLLADRLEAELAVR